MSIAEQIRGDIEARILSGEWRPGVRIPIETELVAQYRCARATVSKALAALARSGLIERRRKAGSFVAHPQIHSAVLDIPDIGAAIAARTGSYRFVPLPFTPGRQELDAGGFAETATLRCISGVHWGGDEPFAYETRLINLDAVPLARDIDFGERSPGSWLLHHVPWSEARHRISAIGASAATASLLAIRRHTPCLQVERHTWASELPITYARQVFPGDRYDLFATFNPQRASNIT